MCAFDWFCLYFEMYGILYLNVAQLVCVCTRAFAVCAPQRYDLVCVDLTLAAITLFMPLTNVNFFPPFPVLTALQLKREAKLMKAGKASKATTTGARTSQKEEPANGRRGFRRRIQFRQAGDGGGGGAGALSRAAALDEAQVALDLFYSSFPVVPLLSVAHAKVSVFKCGRVFPYFFWEVFPVL